MVGNEMKVECRNSRIQEFKKSRKEDASRLLYEIGCEATFFLDFLDS
jgi:hypothetical protein